MAQSNSLCGDCDLTTAEHSILGFISTYIRCNSRRFVVAQLNAADQRGFPSGHGLMFNVENQNVRQGKKMTATYAKKKKKKTYTVILSC